MSLISSEAWLTNGVARLDSIPQRSVWTTLPSKEHNNSDADTVFVDLKTKLIPKRPLLLPKGCGSSKFGSDVDASRAHHHMAYG